MTVLLDNTILSNFAVVQRPDLLQHMLGTVAATTADVVAEFEAGVAVKRVPATDWGWLPVLALSSQEQVLYWQLRQQLNAGEAACLSVAFHRQARLLSDDRDARVLAGQMRVPVGGTLGVLVRLVRTQRLSLAEANQMLTQMMHHGYRSPVDTLDELI